MTPVYSFKQLPERSLSRAGGKGGTLAKLFQAGLPVPEGFVILPSAFDEERLTPKAWEQVEEQLNRLRQTGVGGTFFAVRSSALAEDSARASFAGGFETILNARTDSEVQNAISAVRRSRREERVRAYSQAQRLDEDHEMAVVVQRMIQSEISGVLFTADPVTGNRGVMAGNFVHGLGDRLVSGEVDAESFTFHLPGGKYSGPPTLKPFAKKLFGLAHRLEKTSGCPQDIEWAIAGGALYLLQSRPITTLIARNPETGEWNDSLSGDFLWTNTNFGEAVTEPMTPLAGSVLQFTLEDWVFVHGYSTTGIVGGMPYLNISLFTSVFKALGRSREDLLDTIEGTLFLRLPDEMEIPHVPLRFRQLLRSLQSVLHTQYRQKQGVRQLENYLADNPAWFEQTREKLQQKDTRQGLLQLWIDEIVPHVMRGVWIVLGTASHSSDYTVKLRRDLTKFVGSDDANTLISNVNEGTVVLPSLGPLVGMAKVAKGEISRDDYLRDYGHRGPHEFEISAPRPVEDPSWVDQQLAQFAEKPVDVDALLQKQREVFEAAWVRLASEHPAKANTFARRIEESNRRARLRECARSEYVRDRWMVRLFACRAGELLGLGDDVFYLSLEELLHSLSDHEDAFEFIPARKETYRRYKSLPALPSIIRGRFDPFRWAEDPNRRSDFFDASLTLSAMDTGPGTLSGCPGSAGQVEGTVRVILKPEEGHLLREGEILVTVQTDIAWTMLFPRARAIVTDVGAPLSHAAIVARELGIPAVVGCAGATAHLKSGDRVRVDGGHGTVAILGD